MHPILFNIPLGGGKGFPIHSYGVLIACGFFIATIIALRRSKKAKIDPNFILDLNLYIMLSGIVGSRIGFLINFHQTFDWGVFNLSDGGFNIFFGLLVTVIAFWKINKILRKKLVGDKKSQFIILWTKISILSLSSLLTFVIFGRLSYLILHYKEYNWELFKIWHGGIVFYGGLLGAFIVSLIYIKLKKEKILKITDFYIPLVFLGLAFGRVGCLLNGCCYGKHVDNFACSITFPKLPQNAYSIDTVKGSFVFVEQLKNGLVSENDERSLPVIPTQPISSFMAIILFIVLSLIWNKAKTPGITTALGGILYSINRFLIEFMRGDNKPYFGWMTFSQFISFFVLILSLIFFIYLIRRRKDGTTQTISDSGTNTEHGS